jgi:1,4-alpha-glucan branching enzyme
MHKRGLEMARTSRTKATEFKFFAPQAKRVSLAGTFNKWNTKTLAAKKDEQGNWAVRLSLKPGKYEYKFFVDNNWANDPRCNSCVTNAFGTQNCTIEVK